MKDSIENMQFEQGNITCIKDFWICETLLFRRKQIMERHEKMNERREEEYRMKEAMRDQHREQILKQIENDRAREDKQYEMLQQQRGAKAAIR